MNFTHYHDEPLDVAVDFTNTLDVVSGDDGLGTPEDLAAFIRTHLPDLEPAPVGLTERDLRLARELRSRLRSVWDADDAEGAAAAINVVLDMVDADPRVVATPGAAPHLVFDAPTDHPVKRLGAVAALGVSSALIAGDRERFGTCSSAACDDVYIDSSKNRSRRYCSDTCTTRESVAAYRARHKA